MPYVDRAEGISFFCVTCWYYTGQWLSCHIWSRNLSIPFWTYSVLTFLRTVSWKSVPDEVLIWKGKVRLQGLPQQVCCFKLILCRKGIGNCCIAVKTPEITGIWEEHVTDLHPQSGSEGFSLLTLRAELLLPEVELWFGNNSKNFSWFVFAVGQTTW